MDIELFDARVLKPLVTYLGRHGVSAQALLHRSRIPPELVEEGGWVAKKQAYDFTFDVVKRTKSLDVVFDAYRHDFALEQLGPIADAMKSCKTVKEALDVATRLGHIAYQGSEYFLREEGQTTWFCYREPHVVSEGQPFISDMTLAVYWHLLRITTNEDWYPEQVVFRGEATQRCSSVRSFENCRSGVHAEYSALAFPTEFLSRRLPWNEAPRDFDLAHAWRFGPTGSEPIVDSLYRLLASRFECHSLPTLPQVAAMVGTSQATLKRQLAAAGMTYRGLLDRLRFDAACEMLTIPELTLCEIAHDLGYSGTNNFVRSFRRMTGCTPGQFRNQGNSIPA